MKIDIIELEKSLSSEAKNKTDNSKRHLAELARDANALFRAQKRFGKKLDEFAKDEAMPNDIRCRFFEKVREHTGVPKSDAKLLLEKFRLAERIEKSIPKDEKLIAREFFELDCLLKGSSKKSSKQPPTSLTDEDLKTLLALSRKYKKTISHLLNKIKKKAKEG